MDKNQKYIKAQKAWIKMFDLQPGDSVKVLSTAKDYEHGWRNSWTDTMDTEVGLVLTFVKDIGENGIALKNGRKTLNTFAYPFYVLQKVYKPMPEPITLSKDCKVTFLEDGSINVGSQNISFDVLEKIYQTADEVKSN